MIVDCWIQMKTGFEDVFEQAFASARRYGTGNPATKATWPSSQPRAAKSKQGIEIEVVSNADKCCEYSYYEFANLIVSKPGNSVSRL